MFTFMITVLAVFTATALAMPTIKRDYAAASDVVSGAGDAWYSSDLSSGTTSPSSTYKCYYGEVTNYPTITDWLSFDALWSNNEATISTNNGDNEDYVTYIKSAITQVSQESNLDARVILAVVMQESSGTADVECTGNGNCGLMQGPIGSTAFDASNAQASILQMIEDGVQGTSEAPGFSQYMANDLSWITNPYPGNPYAAARAYNSGSVSSTDNLDTIEWGTASYSNDIANRLLGWIDEGTDPFTTSC